MRHLHHISFLALLALTAGPALAEQKSPYKGGMNFTAISQTPPADVEASEESKSAKKDDVKYNDVTPESAKQESEAAGDDEKTEAAEDAAEMKEDTSKRIWNRYKALASGEAKDEDGKDAPDDDAEDTDEKDSKDKAEKTADSEAAVKPTGFAAILDRYEQNKAQQSQMRTINIGQPESTDKNSESTKDEDADKKSDIDAETDSEKEDKDSKKSEEEKD